MKATSSTASLIASFEGCRLRSYQDSTGIWTIGYGTTMYADGSPVKQGEAVTLFQAKELLKWQIELKSAAVAKLLKPVVVSHNRFDALCSFAYNCGTDALAKSTLLKLIKKDQDDPSIREAFMAWCKITVKGKKVVSPGLVARREKEADLWFSIT